MEKVSWRVNDSAESECEELIAISLSPPAILSFPDPFTIEFQDGLNVLVGENGAGKTGVIAALRQLFLQRVQEIN